MITESKYKNLSTHIISNNVSAGNKKKNTSKNNVLNNNISINTNNFANKTSNNDNNYIYNINSILNKNINNISSKTNNLVFCFYRILDNKNTTDNEKPFLQYLLYKYPESNKDVANLMVFPFIKYNSNKKIKQQCDDFTKKIFGSSLEIEGYIEQYKDIYVFFNINKIFKGINRYLFLENDTEYWWAIMDEICNHKRVLYNSVHSSVYSFFYKHPNFIYLKNENDNTNIEIPRVAFRGYNSKDVNNVILFQDRNGNYDNSDTVFNLNHFYSLDYSFKGAIQNYYNNPSQENNEGSIIRYALFLGELGKTKVFINKEIENIIKFINKNFKNDNANSIILTNALFKKQYINTYIEYFIQGSKFTCLSYHNVNIKNKFPIWDKNEKYNLV
tara:strand:- start:7247 stop:8407 length:1161 start_codon:yes stop_codon:yes gene_type:complete